MMKNLLLCAAFAAMTAPSAFATTRVVSPITISPTTIENKTEATRKAPFANNTISNRHALATQSLARPAKAARAAGNEIIYDKPEGTEMHYLGFFMGYMVYNTSAMQVMLNNEACTMVRNGNKVYIKNIVPTAMLNSWVEGTISDDGTTITVPTGQIVEYIDYYKSYWKLQVLYFDAPNSTYRINDDYDHVTFHVDEDGVISSEFTDNTMVLGICYDETQKNAWSGYACWSDEYTPVNLLSFEIPADIDDHLQNYAASYRDQYGYQNGKEVKVAIIDNDVYVKGLFGSREHDWLHGHIEGDKVIVEKDQFVGYYLTNYLFVVPSYIEDEEIEGEVFSYLVATGEDLEFDYDPATKTFSSDGIFASSPSMSDNFYDIAEAYQQPSFFPFAGEVPAVPTDPFFFSFYDYNDYAGYGIVNASFPAKDVDGNFILPDKMYFRMYLDDNLYTFSPDVYIYLEEETTDMPLYYDDDWDFEGGGYFVFYESNYRKLGIQSVYKGGGETNCSNIVWVEHAGVETIADKTEKAVKSVSYTDLLGRPVAKPGNGFIIRTTTFSDGSKVSEIQR